MTVNEFTQAAMELSSEERAALARELLSSLEPSADIDDAEVESAWRDESARRARQVRGGEVNGDRFVAVRDRLLRTFSDER